MSKHYAAQKKAIARLVREFKQEEYEPAHGGKARSRKQAIAHSLKHARRRNSESAEIYAIAEGMLFA